MNSSKLFCTTSFLILSLICYLTFFYRLGDSALWDPDEGRSGTIAMEILTSGNWVTLTHNGDPYYDKPAPYFGLVALCLNFLGFTELAVRLPSAVAASLTVGLVFLWGYLSGGWKRGFWGGIVLATSLEFMGLARLGKMDMLFSLFFSSALFYFLWWQNNHSRLSSEHGIGEVRRQIWIWPFYVFLALACLTKGPVGIVLPLLIAGLTLALGKRMVLLRQMKLIRGMVIMLLVAGPLYIWAGLQNPEYIKTFLWDHNILRFFTSQRGVFHPQPVYYFIPVLIIGFLPWSFFLPPVLHHHWETRKNEDSGDRLFFQVWFATIFIFFSISQNKLAPYILPAFPPLALLTGDYIREFVEAGDSRPWRKRWILCATFIWLLSILLISPATETFLKYRPEYLPITPPIFPIVILVLLMTFAWLIRRETWTPYFVLVSYIWLVMWFHGVKTIQLSELRSTRSLALSLTDSHATSPFRIITTRAESLSFYMPNKVQVLPNSLFVESMLRESLPTVAVIKKRHLSRLQQSLLPRFFVWDDSGSMYALVGNFSRPNQP